MCRRSTSPPDSAGGGRSTEALTARSTPLTPTHSTSEAPTIQFYFSTCGTHTLEAQASDKDGGVSAQSPQATQSVSVYNGAFDPPLVDGSTNMVQRGQVVPVEISIGCGTTTLTNLTPHIQLLSGNVSPESESGRTTVTTTSVLAADTTETMRHVDGGYIYNLQVPSNATANQEFTIRVDPFGATE